MTADGAAAGPSREGFLTRQPPLCTAIHSPRAGQWVGRTHSGTEAEGGTHSASVTAEHVGGEPEHPIPARCCFPGHLF